MANPGKRVPPPSATSMSSKSSGRNIAVAHVQTRESEHDDSPSSHGPTPARQEFDMDFVFAETDMSSPPDGGLRAWLVVLGCKSDSHYSTQSLTTSSKHSAVCYACSVSCKHLPRNSTIIVT